MADDATAQAQETTEANEQVDENAQATDTDDKGTEQGGEEKTSTDGKEKQKEAKPNKEGEEEEGAPERYELKTPDETKLRTADIKRIEAEARELGLTNEEAQSYLETHHKAAAAAHEGLMEDFEAERKSWAKTASEDKEIGGENFQKNVEVARRLIKSVASKDFYKEVLAPKSEGGMGYGDHPEMIRIFTRLAAKGFADDTLEHNTQTTAGKRKSDGEVFYGGAS